MKVDALDPINAILHNLIPHLSSYCVLQCRIKRSLERVWYSEVQPPGTSVIFHNQVLWFDLDGLLISMQYTTVVDLVK